MDVVADGGAADEQAHRYLKADDLGEPRQPQDRHLRREPALDPTGGRGGEAGSGPHLAEAEVPISSSNADLPARRADGRVSALVGAVNDALDRCHTAIVAGVAYRPLICRSSAAHLRSGRTRADRVAPAPVGRARARACVQRNTAQAVTLALQVLARHEQETCRGVGPAGPGRRRPQESGRPTQGSCRRGRWTRESGRLRARCCVQSKAVVGFDRRAAEARPQPPLVAGKRSRRSPSRTVSARSPRWTTSPLRPATATSASGTPIRRSASARGSSPGMPKSNRLRRSGP